MKKYFYTCLLAVFIVSCSSNEDDDLMDDALIVVEEMEAESDGSYLFMGDFVSGAHPTTGKVTIDAQLEELFFKSFKTDNGPKLLVYLSSDIESTEYVDLGDLKGIEGDYSYTIPKDTDLSKFKYVNIWCVDFSVSFGHAELKN